MQIRIGGELKKQFGWNGQENKNNHFWFIVLSLFQRKLNLLQAEESVLILF